MNSCTDNERIELQVENFGPIAEAKVDMRSLNVFVGPSNSGKSYLATLIYAFHQFISEFHSSKYYGSLIDGADLDNFLCKLDENNTVPDYFQSFADSAEISGTNVPKNVIEQLCVAFSETASSNFDLQLRRCFGVNKLSSLIRKKAKSAIVRIVKRQNDKSSATTLQRQLLHSCVGKLEIPLLGDNSVAISEKRANFYRKIFEMNKTGDLSSGVMGQIREYYLIDLLKQLLHAIAEPLVAEAFYLPSDRAGIMRLQLALVRSLIKDASKAGLDHIERTPVFSGVYADFLANLTEIEDNSEKIQDANIEISKAIESNVLKGSVWVKRSDLAKYPQFLYRPNGWEEDLPLINVSSMISELTPLVLYLRHVVLPGNVLIIEEPESHLHPEMQVELVRQLALIVKNRIRVIVTTHSELVLDELANIVKRSQIQPQKELPSNSKLNYSLNSDQVGVWRFEEGKNTEGSNVREIVLNDSDLYPSGFSDAATEVHNQWAVITDTIENNS